MPKKDIEVQASILKRIGAFIIDMLILNFFVLFPFQGIMASILPREASISETFKFLEQTGAAGTIMLIFAMVSFISLLYFFFLERKLGQTPGKMLFRLYVVGQEKETRSWQYIIRSLFLIPIFPLILLWIIDPLVMLFTKDHHRLCEILSKTSTVEVASYERA